jgi:hypothetical protein
VSTLPKPDPATEGTWQGTGGPRVWTLRVSGAQSSGRGGAGRAPYRGHDVMDRTRSTIAPWRAALVALSVLCAAVPVGVSPARAESPAVESFLVTLRPFVSAEQFVDRRAESIDDVEIFDHALNGFVAEMTDETARRLADDPRVAAIETDGQVTVADTVADTADTSVAWGLDRIDQRTLPLSGSYTPVGDGAGVLMYVVDTGVRADHRQFAGRVTAGHSVVPGDAGTGDCHGHGTHVAGIAGGSVSGVAPAVTIVPVRVLDCGGKGTASDVVRALDWIIARHRSGGAEHGRPAVVNMSLGTSASTALDAAVRRLVDTGLVAIVAAGNRKSTASPRGDACAYSPAREPSAITVAASTLVSGAAPVTTVDQLAWFSHAGRCVDLIAPGAGIVSADHRSSTGTIAMSGTSMAAPHVAGAAALALADRPTATPAEIASLILDTASVGHVTGLGETGTVDRLLYVEPDPDDTIDTSDDGLTAVTAFAIRATGWNPSETSSCTSTCAPQFWRVPRSLLAGDTVQVIMATDRQVRVCLSSGASAASPCDVPGGKADVHPSSSGRTVRLPTPAAISTPYLVVRSIDLGAGYTFGWLGVRHRAIIDVIPPSRAVRPIDGVVRARVRLADGSPLPSGAVLEMIVTTRSGIRISRPGSVREGGRGTRYQFPLGLRRPGSDPTARVRVRVRANLDLVNASSTWTVIPLDQR